MAEQQDTTQERTEQATPKRLQEAREKGQVARSRELTTTAILLVSAGGLLLVGPTMLEDLTRLVRKALTRPLPTGSGAGFTLTTYLEEAFVEAILAIAPFLGLATVVALVAPLALGGWSFSPAAFAFKWEKMDPVKGFGRLFSMKAAMELTKALAKFLLIIGVATGILWYGIDASMGLANVSLSLALKQTAEMILWAFLALSASTAVIAAVDVPFQLWDNARKLKMTRQEVKDEFKETEGKPEVKQRIRTLQREVAERRMMEAIPTADVVITNPTHYAVALRYAAGEMAAPRVVARGVELVSARIRERARAHRVPIVAAPPLARAIYYSTELEREIPAGLYLAVAAVLRYAYRLRGDAAYRAAPAPPRDLPIPEELAHG